MVITRIIMVKQLNFYLVRVMNFVNRIRVMNQHYYFFFSLSQHFEYA